MSLPLEYLEANLYIGHLRGSCSYLPERDSNLKFLDGSGLGAGYRLLLDRGYRRHGQHLYRPDCGSCQQCKILRIPVATFVPTRSQKRVYKKGKSIFRAETGKPEYSPEKARLYERYLKIQHCSCESIDAARYEDFFVSSFLSTTEELRIYAGDRLVGIGIIDIVGDALSSVYFFFDPEFADYSPGTFSILVEMDLCRERGLSYYYPGFFIPNCSAMNYKANFGPAEVKAPEEEKWAFHIKSCGSSVDAETSD
ncbi:MAG: arginyltransferase [Spirochaetia bacterium]|nr:arginyltransferase [Spirochaetia bacterium]